MIYVQFSDVSKTVITALFGGPQDLDFYPFQGNVEASDPRYKVYYDAMPESIKEYWPTPE